MAKQKEQLARLETEVHTQSTQLENLKQDYQKEHGQQIRQTTAQSLRILGNDKKIARQKEHLSELSCQIEETEELLNEISAIAYDKAVAVISEKAAKDALNKSVEQIDTYLDWLESPERKADRKTLDYTIHQFATLRKHVLAAVKKLTSGLSSSLSTPEVKKPALEKIKEEARPSVLQKLQRRQEEIAQREQNRAKPKKRSYSMEL